MKTLKQLAIVALIATTIAVADQPIYEKINNATNVKMYKLFGLTPNTTNQEIYTSIKRILGTYNDFETQLRDMQDNIDSTLPLPQRKAYAQSIENAEKKLNDFVFNWQEQTGILTEGADGLVGRANSYAASRGLPKVRPYSN